MNAMAPTDLKTQLRSIIAEVIEKDPSEIRDDVLLKDQGVDSMQAIEIISDIERTFKLKIDEKDFKHITTLDSVHQFLTTRLAPPAA